MWPVHPTNCSFSWAHFPIRITTTKRFITKSPDPGQTKDYTFKNVRTSWLWAKQAYLSAPLWLQICKACSLKNLDTTVISELTFLFTQIMFSWNESEGGNLIIMCTSHVLHNSYQPSTCLRTKNGPNILWENDFCHMLFPIYSIACAIFPLSYNMR